MVLNDPRSHAGPVMSGTTQGRLPESAGATGFAILLSFEPQIDLVLCFFTARTVNPNNLQQGVEGLRKISARFLVTPPDHSEAAVRGSKSAAKDVVECIQIAIPAMLALESYLAEVLGKTSKVAEPACVDDDLRFHTLTELRRSAAGGQRSWPTARWTGLLGVMANAIPGLREIRRCQPEQCMW